MLEDLKEKVCAANKELARQGLVILSIGNVSGRDRRKEYVVIKPEGLSYEEMTPADMVVTDLNGEVVEGSRQPSGYIHAHCFIYKHRKDVGGIAHTHSPYATSYAVQGKPIPAYLIPHTANFGGDIPVTQKYDTEHKYGIGSALLKAMKKKDEKAVLLDRHGIFTFGSDAREAVKLAAMLEDLAKTYRAAGR